MLYINLNGHWTHKDKQSEVEVGIVENKIKRFFLTYVTPLMDVGPLQKYLRTLSDTTTEGKS